MDVLSLYQNGITNVISNSGTALTERQIELVWKFFSNPLICLDGDTSGQNAAKRISERVGIHFSSIDLRKTSAVLFAKSGATASELKEVYGFRTKQIAQKYFNEGNERRLLEKQMNFKPI